MAINIITEFNSELWHIRGRLLLKGSEKLLPYRAAKLIGTGILRGANQWAVVWVVITNKQWKPII